MRSSAKHYVSVSVDLERGYLTQKKYIFKQFDNLSRVINFKLTNKSRIDLTDKKVYKKKKKADRNVVMLDGIITDEKNGEFICELTTQVLACVGDVFCEVMISDNLASALSFPQFTFNVQPSIHADDNVTSSTELAILSEALAKVENWNGQVDDAIVSCEEKYDIKYQEDERERNDIFNESQREREHEFATWHNLAMSQQVALDLQNQINNMPFFKIIE